MSKKKKTKRSQSKYPALDPSLNLKTRVENLDFDYINTLPEEWTDLATGKKYNPKQYLNDFVNEYVHAEFDNTKKRIHKKKRVENQKNEPLRQLKQEVLDSLKVINELILKSNIAHASKVHLKKILLKFKDQLKRQFKTELSYIDDSYKKDAYDRNNSRNRCVLTRAKAQGKASTIDILPETYAMKENVEDELIEAIDLHFAQKLKNSQNGGNNGSQNGN